MITRSPSMPPARDLLVERDEVVAAIDLVRMDASPRVLVVGLVHALELAARLAPLAADAGVLLEPRSGSRPGAVALLVRRRPTVLA